MKVLNIFKPGTFTDTSGTTLTFSEADLRAIAAAYDPKKHDAPLVVGHPKSNAPAYGWTRALTFEDGFLKAITHEVSTQFSEWVAAKHYKKISASFYSPNNPNNPVPGIFYLRHIGFLGAMPPAVKGLPDVDFCGNDSALINIEFSEITTSKPLTNDPKEIAKLALEFQEEMQQYGEPVSCSEAVSAILANITSVTTVDFSEQLTRPTIDACLLQKINRASKLKNGE
jgi:hypothetical protein